MPVAKNPFKEHVYVLLEDRGLPEEKQTRFYYKGLTAEQYYKLQDSLIVSRGWSDDSVKEIRAGHAEFFILMNCLSKIENFFDEDGNELRWPQDEEGRKRILSFLTPEQRRELANAISENSRWTVGEKKL